MDKQHIIKQEDGTLYLKLREEFNTTFMKMHHTMACIHRDWVKVIKTDSNGEVNSKQMTLSMDEFDLLAQGVQMVHHFWYEQVLPEGHVLLNCGCVIKWYDEEEYPAFRRKELPFLGDRTWCGEHEEARVYRFNVDDFARIEEE